MGSDTIQAQQPPPLRNLLKASFSRKAGLQQLPSQALGPSAATSY